MTRKMLQPEYGYCDSCTTAYLLGPKNIPYRWRLGDRCHDLSLSRDFTDPCPGIIRDRLRPDMPIAICRTCQQVHTCEQVKMKRAWDDTQRCPLCDGVLDPVMGRFPVRQRRELTP